MNKADISYFIKNMCDKISKNFVDVVNAESNWYSIKGDLSAILPYQSQPDILE